MARHTSITRIKVKPRLSNHSCHQYSPQYYSAKPYAGLSFVTVLSINQRRRKAILSEEAKFYEKASFTKLPLRIAIVFSAKIS